MKVFTGRSTGRVVAARFTEGSDLLDSVNQLAAQAGFSAATVQFIGAAHKAIVQILDQATKQYVTVNVPGPLEITCGTGNVSLKDGKPFAHIHVTVSDTEGHCFGGHVAPGTELFLAEVVLTELAMDTPLERRADPATGIAVWE